MEFIGRSREKKVIRAVREMLFKQGLRGMYLNNETEVEFPDEHIDHPQGEPVYMIHDLPFYQYQDYFVPFGLNAYHVYRDVYLPVIKQQVHCPLPHVFYPITYNGMLNGNKTPDLTSYLKRIQTIRDTAHEKINHPVLVPSRERPAEEPEQIRDYTRKLRNDYKSHFLGEKNKRVGWYWTFDGTDAERVLDRSEHLFEAHFNRKNDGELDYDGEIYDCWNEYKDQEIWFVVYAVDEETHQLVAAMPCSFFPQNLTVDCGFVAANTDEFYQPYSLIPAACVYAGWVANTLNATCNYGYVDDADGAYKMAFSQFVPLQVLRVL